MNISVSDLNFHVNRRDEVFELVEKFHYSRRVPSNVQFVASFHSSGGLFGDLGRCEAGIVFSIPPTRWSESVLELSKLIRRDESKLPLTALISKAVSELYRRGLADLLVSFADQTHHHHGGVYRAASWNYDGMRSPSMDGIVIAGTFVPGRSANSVYGTRSPERLAAIGIDAEPHYDEGKHLYWRALDKRGAEKAARLGLGKLPW